MELSDLYDHGGHWGRSMDRPGLGTLPAGIATGQTTVRNGSLRLILHMNIAVTTFYCIKLMDNRCGENQ
ncbi:MAG: hypothetical protein AAGI03_16140 [Pseudomonadota bacterium]